jgi:hypothetical protein
VVKYERKGVNKLDITLTKDADKLICLIYKDYLERRERGISKSSAKAYAERSDWPKSLTDHFSAEDVRDTLRELKNSGFTRNYWYGGFTLTDQGIAYMENRFPNGVAQILEWMGRIKGAVPFM